MFAELRMLNEHLGSKHLNNNNSGGSNGKVVTYKLVSIPDSDAGISNLVFGENPKKTETVGGRIKVKVVKAVKQDSSSSTEEKKGQSRKTTKSVLRKPAKTGKNRPKPTRFTAGNEKSVLSSIKLEPEFKFSAKK